jgi:hypothetical protein
MKQQTILKISGLLLMAGASLLYGNAAKAGSNSGSALSTVGFSCDNRTSVAGNFAGWCTTVNANLIKNKCVVVVHVNSPIQNCGWQGCGYMSFVNERPLLQNNNVVEYGIATPSGVSNLPAAWEFNSGSVMPKAPFPRHYLTVDQFVMEREKCKKQPQTVINNEIAAGTVLGRICGVTPEVMSLNPYYFCMLEKKVIPNQ